MPDQLFNLFNSIIPMSIELKKAISSILRYKEFKKNSYLLDEGQVSNHVYFIKEGLVRSYYLKDGEEISTWFMLENDVVFSIKSFYNRVPSKEIVQCIKNTTLYYISYEELDMLYTKFVEFNIVGRVLTEKYYMLSEERLFSMRRQSAKERYLYILKNHGKLVKIVPQKYLASYLGISVETLSKMKIKLKN